MLKSITQVNERRPSKRARLFRSPNGEVAQMKQQLRVNGPIARTFRKYCAIQGVGPNEKLEMLLVQWQAYGSPDWTEEFASPKLGDNDRRQFTVRHNFYAPVKLFSIDHSIPVYKIIEAIIGKCLAEADFPSDA